MGRWHDGKGGLAHSERVREDHWCRQISAARSPSDLCATLPCFGRGVGADPIPFGACLGSNHRTVPLAASSGFDQQSMIALASSRILELGATVMEGWPTIHDLAWLVDTRTLVGTDFGPRRIDSGVSGRYFSLAGCRRTKLQILARDSRDPMGGIERCEGPHESAAAIGCNHRHDVHVVAKKV
jgi:hypothetical protein